MAGSKFQMDCLMMPKSVANNELPLPNPVSPQPGTFAQRLISTRKQLRQARKNSDHRSEMPAVRDAELPKLSVMVISYNHEKFIAQALDSILMQERDFSIEINVIDDASTDGTQQIVREYATAHPGLINCYFNPENAGHITTQLNTIRGFKTLRGEYFAILEGDDYWTDAKKLAKQVSFLDQNAEFVACAHYTNKVFMDDRPPEHFLPFTAFGRDEANMYDIISMSGVFHLSSIVYRNVFKQSPPDCLYDPYSCEITINMIYAMYGKFYCIPQYMSSYRVHDGGVFSVQNYEQYWNFHLSGFYRFALYMGPRYWLHFTKAIRGFSRYVLMAPWRTKEVASLKPSTTAKFLFSFIFAASACLAPDALRLSRRAGRRIIRGSLRRVLCEDCPRLKK